MKRIRRAAVVILILLACFWAYVEIMNRDSKNMSMRQKVLKAVYPLWMRISNWKGRNAAHFGKLGVRPPVSFYSLQVTSIDGSPIDFDGLRGKKVLLVNTASDCGYTGQYKDLQDLYSGNKSKLVIIGFPANDFKHQEKGTDQEINQFCKKNFGVSFPLAQKSTVLKSPAQNPVFQWLTDSTKNGWNNKSPSWNFTKYLVDEQGMLINYFGPAISPMSKEIVDAIQN